MEFQKTTLDNGLRVITAPMPHTRSVSVNIFIGTGSRYESDEEAGISHFAEHMFFKGTERRPSAKEISEAIEGVGGVINAGTDREMTVFWTKVARPHFALAFDVLVDILRCSRLEPADIEKERLVVTEEINMLRDDPREWVDVLIDETLWPDQALGRDVIGTKETVSSFDRAMVQDYIHRHYTPSNTVISVAGNVEHDQVLEMVQQALGDWPAASAGPWRPAVQAQVAPVCRVEWKKTEQAHFCLAVPALSSRHPDRFSLDLLNVILGEGMSSRLFQEIREKRGLAYDVHSYISHFLDTGSATVYAGVDPTRIEGAIQGVLEELERLKESVPEQEVVKSREFSKGRLLLRLEDTRSVSTWNGAQELLLEQILTPDEVVAIIDRVTADDLRRVARDLFVAEKLNLAIVGPFRKEKRFAALLKQRSANGAAV